MLRPTFLYAAACLALGTAAAVAARVHDTAVIARSAFFFGGAVLICGCFALKNRVHGLAGAAFLSFLYTLTGAGAVIGQLREGDFHLAAASTRYLLALFAVSLVYLLIAVRAFRKARHERLLRELHAED
ncbi:MAG: hypothetical protein HKN82_09280 [Akkermansiaceae bacterium]|nr:hypothetical protein [Akkermansiaceae bacterium]